MLKPLENTWAPDPKSPLAPCEIEGLGSHQELTWHVSSCNDITMRWRPPSSIRSSTSHRRFRTSPDVSQVPERSQRATVRLQASRATVSVRVKDLGERSEASHAPTVSPSSAHCKESAILCLLLKPKARCCLRTSRAGQGQYILIQIWRCIYS